MSVLQWGMLVSSYLSIDLDYFNDRDRSLSLFFSKVIKLRLPIYIACFHDQLLEHINSSGCNVLYNIDYHSDLSDGDDDLNEGNWVNFVDWRSEGKYYWHRPNQQVKRNNYCHFYTNPFDSKTPAGWLIAKQRVGLNINWKSIKAVGCCLSPDWTQKRDTLTTLMYKLRMPLWWKNLSTDSVDRNLIYPFLLDNANFRAIVKV